MLNLYFIPFLHEKTTVLYFLRPKLAVLATIEQRELTGTISSPAISVAFDELSSVKSLFAESEQRYHM